MEQERFYLNCVGFPRKRDAGRLRNRALPRGGSEAQRKSGRPGEGTATSKGGFLSCHLLYVYMGVSACVSVFLVINCMNE